MRAVWVLAIAGVIAAPLPAVAAPPGPLLLADTNRDGVVNVVDQPGKGRWTPGRGAIFLPNLDDDARRCVPTEADLKDRSLAADERFAACNDAQDEVLNGPADAADFAPLRTLPSRAVAGEVSVSPDRYARLWVERGGTWVSLGAGGALTADELRRGAKLALEGRDVIRDKAVWDGTVTVSLTVPGHDTDSVRLRVAPLLPQTDLRPVRKVITTQPPEPQPGHTAFVEDLRKAMDLAGVPALELYTNWDRWAQDVFEPMTASMPGPSGPKVMHVLLRSANYYAGAGGQLRDGGRVLFTQLRGPDVGVVQQFTTERGPEVADTLNSTGNYESIPPHRGHPLGRPLYGSAPTRQPDPSFAKLIGSQYADPVVIDTSWLAVGHSDETLHAMPARNARGWTFMVADPRLAVDLLRKAKVDGHGDALLYEGTSTTATTIDAVLADEPFLQGNEFVAARIDGQLATLMKEVGLREDELVRVPVLWRGYTWETLESSRIEPASLEVLREQMRTGQAPETLYAAATAGIPNGISLRDGVFGAPDPHGPRVNGVDLYREATERALTGMPVRLTWVEDWDFLHRGMGEVHCGTNSLREPVKADWWR